ncbi:hypothetical protein AB0H88_41935 [Nonomuraea sp. NPDC050680]|uniref:hypothetical protein n=1 Tax=Nonomuraea sp. NPDC050680 TaxID=3154630 RepID=UPI0033D7D62F
MSRWMFDYFTHITGSHVRRDDLDITLAALTVARSCNVGLIPVSKAGTPALTAARLIGVETGASARRDKMGGHSSVL